MGLDPSDQRSPFIQVADVLRTAIRDGVYQPGERLPSVVDLASEFGVAKMTVQRALADLRSDGLLIAWQGRGTFVRDHGERSEAMPAAGQDATAAGLREDIQELRRQLGRLEALLMDLYSRTGQPFPHDQIPSELPTRRAAEA